MTRALNIEANRTAKKWTLKEQAGRVIWGIMNPLFAFSPRPLWGWRRFLLRLAGAEIGRSVHLHPSVQVTIPWNITIGDHASVGDRAILYALGPIPIGPRATISQLAHLCAGTHDWREPTMALMKLPIEIGSDAWVCADAFIGPNVAIGEHAITAALREATSLSVKARRAMGRRGYQVVARDYGWPGVAEAFARIYEDTVEAHRSVQN